MAVEQNIETIVAEAVKAKVEIMMVDALGDPGDLVRRLVAEALTTQVEVDRYSRKKETLISRIVRQSIVEAAQEAMREWIKEQTPAIKAELKKQIVRDKESIATALIESLVRSANNNYGLQVVFKERSE